MDEIYGSLCVPLIFAKGEGVDFRETFPICTKVEGSFGDSY